MSVRGKSIHVSTYDGNDSLRTGIPYAGHILNCLRSLLFFWFHEVIDFVIQIFDMNVEFIQMDKKFFHHPALQARHCRASRGLSLV